MSTISNNTGLSNAANSALNSLANSSSSSTSTTSATGLNALMNPNAAARVAPQKTLGQQDFLKLLSIQMQNQDPTNPVDNTKMISDMANFSSLQGIQDLNKTVSSITTMMTMTQAMQASTLVGHDVITPGTNVTLASGTPPVAIIKPSQALTSVTAQITDANGAVVKSFTFPTLASGEKDLKWDGTDNNGHAVMQGNYTLSAFGTDSSGARATVGTLVANKVTSVDLATTGATLNLADGTQTTLSNVQQIR